MINNNIIYVILIILVLGLCVFNKEAYSYCFDNDDYKYRIEKDNPCDVHEIDMQELEPLSGNIGDKVCMDDNYQFRKKEECNPREFEVYRKESFSNINNNPNNSCKLSPLVHYD